MPDSEEEIAASLGTDPAVAPDAGVDAHEKAEENHGTTGVADIPIPLPMPMPEAVVDATIAAPPGLREEEITITDQDVLFGRGGLTNRHIGNLRYRDIISIHRQDYVNAQKTEKPNVARRIVKAIRTGKNPGRFLRRGEDGRWQLVSDKEAAWKASQALREKKRWSSMKKNKNPPESPATPASAASARGAVVAMDTMTAAKVVAKANAKTVEKAKKRKAAEDAKKLPAVKSPPVAKRMKSDEFAPIPQPPPPPVPAPVAPVPLNPAAVAAGMSPTLPTQASDIAIPAVEHTEEGRKPPFMMLSDHVPTNTTEIFPRDADVLFGRGGRTNHHPGNKRLREIVNKYRNTYNQAKKVDKPKVSKLIVTALRNANPPSRFLRMNDDTTRWEDVGDKRAAEKVSQTLREKDRLGEVTGTSTSGNLHNPPTPSADGLLSVAVPQSSEAAVAMAAAAAGEEEEVEEGSPIQFPSPAKLPTLEV